jgi:hypothetical protein
VAWAQDDPQVLGTAMLQALNESSDGLVLVWRGGQYWKAKMKFRMGGHTIELCGRHPESPTEALRATLGKVHRARMARRRLERTGVDVAHAPEVIVDRALT